MVLARWSEDAVVAASERLSLRALGARDRWLTFPETVVVPVLANRRSIESQQVQE